MVSAWGVGGGSLTSNGGTVAMTDVLPIFESRVAPLSFAIFGAGCACCFSLHGPAALPAALQLGVCLGWALQVTPRFQ